MGALPGFEAFLSKTVPEAVLRAALEEAKRRGISLSKALVEMGGLKEEEVAQLLASFHKVDFQLGPLVTAFSEFKEFTPFTLRRYAFVPLFKTSSSITIATTDPGNVLALDEIRRVTRLNVRVVCVTESSLKDALSKVGDSVKEDFAVSPVKEDVSTVPQIERILEKSLDRGASDIHFEPTAHEALVRSRVDGILHDVEKLTLEAYSPVLSRLKLMLGMDIVEKRLAQDGRMKHKGTKGPCEIRGSTLPTIHGEKLVLRLLRAAHKHPTLESLDIEKDQINELRKICAHPDGLILVAGPTGSGKTTTIYSMLETVNRKDQNVITIEDPVEYEMERTNQVQVNPKIGIQFLNMLPFILRQDPDVIMVGEIREEETAQMVVRAAISGHLVFSTLHAPTAISTVFRLMDMGVQPHMLVASLRASISQRLLRRLCEKCKKSVAATAEQMQVLGVAKEKTAPKLFEHKGCDSCHGLGYNGRFAALEVLLVTEKMGEQILAKDRSGLRREAKAQGFLTIRDQAIKRVLGGETSYAEMLSRCPWEEDL